MSAHDEDVTEAEVVQALADHLDAHQSCTWEQVGVCVYCVDHHERLYQGELPDERRTVPKCEPDAHEWDNGDSMSQCGFYLLCLKCGEQEWT